MAIMLPVASYESTITNKVTSTAATIYVDSFTDDDGNSLTNGLVKAFVIDEGTNTEEFVIGTIDTATSSLTGCLRGVSVADGITEVAGNKHAHSKKASIKITAHPYLVKIIRVLNGTDNLDNVMKNPSSRTISNSRHLTDKEYVDAIAATAGGISAFMTTDAGGLTIDVGAGYFVTGDGVVAYAGNAGYTLTDDSTNYVELDQTGTLTHNTTGFTTGYVPISIVTTSSGDITVNTDARGWLTAPSSDVLVTDDATYGATIAAGDLLFLDTADSKWKLADASAEATCDGQIGVALDAGSDTDTNKRVQVGGLVTGLTGLTAGWAYVSDTAGDISNTTGTYKKICGYAISTTAMFLIQVQSADELTGGNSDLTVAHLNEAATFFANTDITGAQAETLSDGSDASSLHYHTSYEQTKSIIDTASDYNFVGGMSDGLTEAVAGTGAITRTPIQTALLAPGNGDDAILKSGGFALEADPADTDLEWADDPNLNLVCKFKMYSLTNQDVFVGFTKTSMAAIPADATDTNDHVGFWIADGILYASVADGTTQNKTDISSGLTLTNENLYEIVYTGGTDAKFYVNGTLKATLNTNLPDDAGNGPILVIGLTSVDGASADKMLLMRHPFAAAMLA